VPEVKERGRYDHRAKRCRPTVPNERELTASSLFSFLRCNSFPLYRPETPAAEAPAAAAGGIENPEEALIESKYVSSNDALEVWSAR
jgi:hypothetical protein